MQYLIILALTLLVLPAQAEDLPTITHDQIADGRQGLPKDFIGAYETEYGYAVKVGDIIAVNVPSGSGSTTTAVAGYGRSGVGGGVAVAGTRNKSFFQFIMNGTYAATVGKAMLMGLAGGASDPSFGLAPGSLSGAEIRVERMKLGGTRRKPVIWMECALVNSKDKSNLSGTITVSDYDQAMRAGEIYNPNFISREIAIQRLKDAKEMLDIGAYTQDQFDAEKAKYMPFLQ